MKKIFTKVIQFCLCMQVFGLITGIQTAQAQLTNAGFEDGTLSGWSQNGATINSGQTLLSWTINPADTRMAAIVPVGNYMAASAESALGLSAGTMTSTFGGSVTNFGILYQNFSLGAGQSITMYWNYVSEDYNPYNDGSFASLTGPGAQQVQCLVMTVGPPAGLVGATGSYGSSGWHSVTFTANGGAGTYRLGFGCFNWADQGYQPHLYVDNGMGGTSAPGYAVLTTKNVTGLSGSTASSGGTITSSSSTVTSRGVCWNTTGSPTTSDPKTTDGSGVGSFTSTLTGLTQGATYHVRAYAINTAGTAYGAEEIYTVPSSVAPSVTTTAITSITSTTASTGGNVTSDGGASITARGVCYNTGGTPTISDPKVIDPSATTGVFTSALSSLTANTTYYVRAYATNSSGTDYGSQVSFKTGPTAPVAITATPIGAYSFTAKWNTTAGATKYYLDVATDAGFTSYVTGYTNKDVGNVLFYPLTGLTSGQTYFYQVRADNGSAISTSSNTITLTTKVLNNFLVEAAAGGTIGEQMAGQAFTIKITARDATNSVISDWVGTTTITTNSVLSAGGTTTNFVAGILSSHSVTLTLAGTLKTLTSTNVGSPIVVSISNSFTVIPAAINEFTLVANGPVTAGTAFTVTATVYDQYGNVKTNYTGANSVDWTTTATSSPNGTARIIPANGNQTFIAGVATIGGFTFYNSDQSQLAPFASPTITITDAPTSKPGTTSAITVLNAPLDNFKVVAGTTQISGTPFSVTVTARDIYWNTCIDYAGSIRFKSSDDALVNFPAGLQSFAPASTYHGVRTFTNGITINTNGAYWLRAADSAFAWKSGQQENIVVGPGAFSKLITKSTLTISNPATPLVFADPLSRVAGEYVLVTVIPRDAQGNLLYACRDISVRLNASSSDYNGPIVIQNVGDGSYTALVRVTLAGNNIISARYNTTGEIFDQTRTASVSPAPVDLAHILITADLSPMTTDQHSHITVQLKDAFDNNRTTSDGIVTLSATRGVLTGGVTDNSNGTYSATLFGNFGAVGIANISGILTGAISGAITDTENVTITEGMPSLAITAITASPDLITTNETSLISVQLKDQFGNNLTTSRGTVTLATTTGALTAVTDHNDGTYTSTLSTTVTGTATITGSLNDIADGVTGAITDNAVVTIGEGKPALATITISAAPGTITTDETSIVTIQLKDQWGNNLSTQRGTIALSSDLGLVSASATYTINGIYTATLTGDNRGVGLATITGVLTDVADGVTGTIADNAQVTITEGEPDMVQSTISPSPASITTDQASVITVQLKDQHGNNIAHSRGTVTMLTNLGAITAVTDHSDGTYTATLSANNTGTGTATIAGRLDASLPKSTTVTITEGLPVLSMIDITANPTSITADQTSTITVQLKDQWGNNLANSRGTVTMATSPIGHLTAVTDNSNGNYTATFSSTVFGTGTATITGSFAGTGTASGVNGAVTDNATILVSFGNATKLTILSQPSATATAGVVFTEQPVIRIEDQFGNLVTSDNSTNVTATRSTGTDVLKGTLTATASGGLVTFAGLYYTKAESITLGFSSSPVLTTATSTTILVGHAPVDHFDLNAPANFIAGATRAAYTVTRHDVFHNPVTTGSQIIYLFSSSDGANKRFYNAASAGSVITQLTIADAASVGNFWYYDEKTGDHTITGSDTTPADGETGIIDGTDQIGVTPALLKDFIVSGVPDPHDFGTWQGATVEARDTYNNRKTNYVGTVTFSNTDIGATNPADYHFTTGAGADNGIHTFTNTLKFSQVGLDWWLTALDLAEPGKYGYQSGITVQRAVTITANDRSKTYGNVLTMGTTEFTVTDIVSGLTPIDHGITGATLTSSGAIATAGVAGSPYPIATGSATGTYIAANYRIVYSDAGTLTVNPRTLTLSSFLASNKIYDRTTDVTGPGGSKFSDNRIPGDELTLTYTAAFTPDWNVANGKTVNYTGISISGGASALNYVLASTTGSTTADITPKTVTPAIVANNKCYDGGATATLSSQYVTGVISPDVVTLLVTDSNFADAAVGAGKLVTATGLTHGGADAGNYSLDGVTTATNTAEIYPLPVPTITGAAVVCLGTSTYTTESGMTGYTWTVPTGGSITDGSTTNSITVNWTTAGDHTVTVNYTNPNLCTAVTATVKNVTVNPSGQVNQPENQTVCNGGSTIAVIFTTTNAKEGSTTSYAWTVSQDIGLATPGSGNIGAFTATNSGIEPVVATITVTPTYTYGSVSCVGTSESFTITVNPTAQVNQPASQVVCNAAGTTTVTFGTTNTGGTTTYTWTNSLTSIGLAASGSSDIASFTATNATGAPVIATIVVTPHFTNDGVTCDGPAKTFTITVNPTAVMTDPSDQVVCNGAYTTVAFASEYTEGEVTYTWANTNTSVGLAASGTGNIAFTATNTTASQITATIGVTPVFTYGGTSCPGVPQTFTIKVQPVVVPSVTGSASVCRGSSGMIYTTEAGMSGYNWTISGGTITSNAGNIIQVTWNTAGAHWVKVNYTNSNHCSAIIPTQYNVTVNPVPVPAIVTGPSAVCGGNTGVTYTTQSGMTNYLWTVSGGGSIIADGTLVNDHITIRWNTSGTRWVKINYTNGNGCTATAPTQYNIMVNALPVASAITGGNAVCMGSSLMLNSHATGTGTLTYTWASSNPGVASVDNSGVVTPVTAGNTNISYTVTDGSVTHCHATSATHAVVVNSLPVAGTITGGDAVCLGGSLMLSSNATGTGTLTYAWYSSSPGVASVDNSGVVTPVSAGNTNITYTVTDEGSTHCQSTSANYMVVVNSLPVAGAITGGDAVCLGSSLALGSNATGTGTLTYSWASSNPGVASMNNSGVLTPISAGNANITYTVTDGSPTHCQATSATHVAVINSLPVAGAITGGDAVCLGGSLILGSNATGTGTLTYTWTSSNPGVAIVSNSGIVTTVSSGKANITYTVTDGSTTHCQATSATYEVEVYALPAALSGTDRTICINAATTLGGASVTGSTYRWSSAPAGFTSTLANPTVTPTVSTTYTLTETVTATGCTNTHNVMVTVNPLPVPTISGPATACTGAAGVTYSTDASMTGYVWTVSAGGNITSGSTSDIITVSWNTEGAKSVAVNYINANGCSAVAASVKNIIVNPSPGNAGSISGTTSICGGLQGVAFSIPKIPNALAYVWALPSGATIASGDGTPSIKVNFASNASSGNISVYGNNACSNGQTSGIAILVTPQPDGAGVITGPGTFGRGTTGAIYSVEPIANASNYIWSLPAGANIISGANTRSITVDFSMNAVSGNITVYGSNSCASGALSPNLAVTMPEAHFGVYPVPSNGLFNATISSPTETTFSINIYNHLGNKIMEIRDARTTGGKYLRAIDLRPIPSGIYYVEFRNGQFREIRKVLVNR